MRKVSQRLERTLRQTVLRSPDQAAQRGRLRLTSNAHTAMDVGEEPFNGPKSVSTNHVRPRFTGGTSCERRRRDFTGGTTTNKWPKTACRSLQLASGCRVIFTTARFASPNIPISRLERADSRSFLWRASSKEQISDSGPALFYSRLPIWEHDLTVGEEGSTRYFTWHKFAVIMVTIFECRPISGYRLRTT